MNSHNTGKHCQEEPLGRNFEPATSPRPAESVQAHNVIFSASPQTLIVRKPSGSWRSFFFLPLPHIFFFSRLVWTT